MKGWTGGCAVCIVSQHLETELTFVHIMLSLGACTITTQQTSNAEYDYLPLTIACQALI